MSELLGMIMIAGMCSVGDFFSKVTICVCSGIVLGMMFCLILIILFGKHPHFIDEKAKTQMLIHF